MCHCSLFCKKKTLVFDKKVTTVQQSHRQFGYFGGFKSVFFKNNEW